jgi:RimJ/RimL family protein N-acetyltransferase
MELSLQPVDAGDAGALARFLAGSEWPFNLERRIDDDWVRGRLESWHFFGTDSKSFWVRGERDEPVALARVFDLGDITPLLDLKVAASARGRGVGTLALRGVTAWLFSEQPKTGRLGGYTRHDNLAMRRVFEKCGFQQEALHRKAWAVPDGEPVDCVGYAILRDEFVMPAGG